MKKTVLIGPSVITALFLIYFVAAPILIGLESKSGLYSIAYRILSIFMFGVWVVWPMMMSRSLGPSIHNATTRQPVFFAASTITIIFLFSFVPWLFLMSMRPIKETEVLFALITTLAGIALPLVFLLASKHLNDAEVELSIAQPRYLLTVMALLYLPIGVWWLWPRIKNVRVANNLEFS